MHQISPASGFIRKLSPFIERQFVPILSLILFIGLLLRIFALLDLKNSIYFDFMLWDERFYHDWATDIAEGSRQYGRVYGFAPLPAYFMALIYWIFSPDIVLIRYANIALGTLTCFLIYLIGDRMGNRMLGLFAALIACFYEPFIFYSIVPLKTALSIFLFSATIYFLLALFDSKSIPNAFLIGVTLGLLANVQSNAVVWVPFLALVIVWVRFQGKATLRVVGALLVLYAAGLALSWAPFVVRNDMAAGEVQPTTSQAGFNLYLSNQIDYSDGVQFATTVPTDRGIQFTIEASRRVQRALSAGEASRYWTRQLLNSVKQKPWEHTKLLLNKFLLLFNWFEPGDHYDIGFTSKYVPFFRIPFITFWMVLPFGIAGMALSAAGSRKLAALALIFCMYSATLVLFFTSIRIRLPMLVFLIPFAVLGIKNFWEALLDKRRKKVFGYLLVVLLIGIVEFLPLHNTRDMTAFLNTHAAIISSQGDTEGAIPFWEASSNLEGRYSAYANLSLTDVYLMNRSFYKAADYLDRVSDDSFAAALKYEKLGDFLVIRRKGRKAISAYRKALHYNQGLRRPRVKLIKMYTADNPVAAQVEYEKLQYIASFYDRFEQERKTNH
ncbi:hypothetical protein D3OALGA1CA_2775 [Olavius algarvensis associated proteobacterium Delta 3]|nr:hypothetical protein D3OALGA1CA_2775 [Olavius algarvensis associated proteobacterium Delta 3]